MPGRVSRSCLVSEGVMAALLLTLFLCRTVAALFSFDPAYREQQGLLSNLKLLIPWKERGAGAGSGARGEEPRGGWWRPRPEIRPDGPFVDSIPVEFSSGEDERIFHPAGPSLQDLIFLSKNNEDPEEASYELAFYNPPEQREDPPQQEYRLGQLPYLNRNYDNQPRLEQNLAYREEASEETEGGGSDEEVSVGELCAQLVQGGHGLGLLGLQLIQYLCLEHLQREAGSCSGGGCGTCSHQLTETSRTGPQQRSTAPPRPRVPLSLTLFRPPNGRRHWNVISEDYPGQMLQYVNIMNKQHKRMGMV